MLEETAGAESKATECMEKISLLDAVLEPLRTCSSKSLGASQEVAVIDELLVEEGSLMVSGRQRL